jgi:hypothetical protein
VVQKAGQRRVRETGHKTVHAFARGTLQEYIETGKPGRLPRPLLATGLTYNPHVMDTFQTREGAEALLADRVVMGPRVFEGTAVRGHEEPVQPDLLSSFDEAFQPPQGERRDAACLAYEEAYGTELC